MANLEFTFDVTDLNSNETFRLTAKSRVLGRWEREFKGRSMSGLSQMRVNDMEEIAWIACKLHRSYTDNLAQFRDTHEVDLVTAQDMARDEARDRARQEALDNGQEWTEEDARKFDRAFDREWEQGDEADYGIGDGSGPTRRAR